MYREELEEALTDLLETNFVIKTKPNGELVIHTGLKEDNNELLVSVSEEEDDSDEDDYDVDSYDNYDDEDDVKDDEDF